MKPTAAAEVARRLDDAGFQRLDETEPWPAGAAGHRRYVVRDGSVVAWVVPPGAAPTTPYRVVGAHTDSPSFKLKPKPTTGSHGWLQAGVEIYGGPLLNSWLDRELQLAGRLVMLDGTQHLTATGPMLRFPQLAIHLDRAANDGLTLDKQRHMNPVWGLGNPGDVDLLAVLASSFGLVPLPIAFLGAALAVIFTRLITMEEAYDLIDWRLLILIAGMTAFGTAMSKTGAAEYLAVLIVQVAGPLGVGFVLFAFTVLTILLTQTMSNAAAALVMLAVVVVAWPFVSPEREQPEERLSD